MRWATNRGGAAGEVSPEEHYDDVVDLAAELASRCDLAPQPLSAPDAVAELFELAAIAQERMSHLAAELARETGGKPLGASLKQARPRIQRWLISRGDVGKGAVEGPARNSAMSILAWGSDVIRCT